MGEGWGRVVGRKPGALAFAAGATLPTAFCTAHIAWTLAGVRAGDRVLIHAAAGGVGLAAVQLARRLGAEVLATASPGKQSYLRSLGIRHVFNSRTLDFAEQVRAATEGRAVDFVLNSLTSGEFIARTLTTLAAAGRFVEISKRGTWTAEQMAAARPDVRYHVLALDELLLRTP